MMQLNQGISFWILALFTVFISGCGGSGDEYSSFDSSIKINTPDQFLRLFNSQGELAAGEYILVVATSTAGQAGNFSVMVKRNDGSTAQIIDGNWTSSGGQDSDSTCVSGNQCIAIDLQNATGATFELSTDLDGILYLVDDSDSPNVVATAAPNGAGETLNLAFAESAFDEAEYASAYYKAVDPMNKRATLQDFITLHQFDDPDVVHATFRDSKDLGYGRDMYMSSYPNPSVCGGQMTAFYVRNFSVKVVGDLVYGPVNLDASLNNDVQHHFGTNAIEFGLGRADMGDTCNTEPTAKFYVYRSDYSAPGALHPRILRVDLDGRGEKAMPQPCISCHGGKLRQLDRFGRFVAMHAQDAANQIGDTKSKLQALEVDSFEFSDRAGQSRADNEDRLREFNNAIFCTYPGSAAPTTAASVCASYGGGVTAQVSSGEWSGDVAREVLLGWYGDALEISGSKFDGSFVPSGWKPSVGGPPVGTDVLFTKVIGPNCFVCHGKLGTELGSEFDILGEGKDLDFSSWSKFISHADEIERLVFDEGTMPLGLINYQDFWGDPEKPELLASFIAPHVLESTSFEARRTNAQGNIILPGRVVARAGPDRVTRQNDKITLNAQASLYADSFSWTLISSPEGAAATISSTTRMRTDFSADSDGEYLVRLNAENSSTGLSKDDDITILVDNSLATAPRNLKFYTDISTRLNDCATECHSTGGGTRGGDGAGVNPELVNIPVWWSDDASQPAGGTTGIPTTNTDPVALGFYEQVKNRVNLKTIEDSLILNKPSNSHHFGGLRPGFHTTLAVGLGNRADYDMFVNWISEGAVCGGTATQCP